MCVVASATRNLLVASIITVLSTPEISAKYSVCPLKPLPFLS
jgi:hypothetical protein